MVQPPHALLPALERGTNHLLSSKPIASALRMPRSAEVLTASCTVSREVHALVIQSIAVQPLHRIRHHAVVLAEADPQNRSMD